MMTGSSKSDAFLRRSSLAVAALASFAALIPAPAMAGRGHGGYHYRPHHYGHDYSYGHYRPYRHHYYSGYRHRGGISAGEGALIAAGIIGGVILIDRALDDRDRYRDRYYDDRRDSDRRYDDRRYDDRRGAFDDDYYYQRDSRPYEDGRYASRSAEIRSSDDLDGVLLGDRDSDAGRATVLADAAFRECVAETRGAAGAGGMNVAMPGAPTDIEQLADGSVRMTAQFRATNARGDSWTRRFVCEADDGGVRFLQVD